MHRTGPRVLGLEGTPQAGSKQSFFVAQPNFTFQFSVHGWGWVHLILGIVGLGAGACVLLGRTWASALRIVLAVFSGLSYFVFLPYYPLGRSC